MKNLHGALLVRKPQGISSFGVIELLQRQLINQYSLKKRKELPKLGHGGTLDPFATGLLVILVGNGVKLSRYFLGADKAYEGIIRFGDSTASGDPTSPVIETSSLIPESREKIQDLATQFTLQPYLQTPPMHSAKKKNGVPLYELARQGLEIEREPKLCKIYEFLIHSFEAPEAHFQVRCSSGTYIRTLAQDLGRLFGTCALLKTLNRTSSGVFDLKDAWTPEQIKEASAGNESKTWDQLPCWIPFDRLLMGYDRVDATFQEKEDICMGRQSGLSTLVKRATLAPSEDCVALYCEEKLFAIARKDSSDRLWGLERVFSST
jgi:tRNA pseudouridine55 synthase